MCAEDGRRANGGYLIEGSGEVLWLYDDLDGSTARRRGGLRVPGERQCDPFRAATPGRAPSPGR